MFGIRYSQGVCAEVSHPALQMSIPGVKHGAITSGSGPCTCSENGMDLPFKMALASGSRSQDGVGIHVLCRHHTVCRDAAPPTAIWSKCSCTWGLLHPHPLLRLAADNWIKNSPVRMCLERCPSLWATDQYLLSD